MSTLNKKAVRELLLAVAKQERPFQKITRVGEEAFPKIEAAVRRAAIEVIRAMPRCGQTIKVLVAAYGFFVTGTQAGEPLVAPLPTPPPPVFAPPPLAQPVMVTQQNGSMVTTTLSPQPVMVIQQGCTWMTSDGRTFIPIPAGGTK